MRFRIVLVALVTLCLTVSPAWAGCLQRSQNAITAVQVLNAYSISRYTWAGDPQYDQVLPVCSKTALREFACNAVFNLGLRAIEGKSESKMVCALNYLGAAAYAFYIRKAVGVQVFGVRF